MLTGHPYLLETLDRDEVERIQVQIQLAESVRRLLEEMVQYCVVDSVKDVLHGVATRQEDKLSLLCQDLGLPKEDITR